MLSAQDAGLSEAYGTEHFLFARAREENVANEGIESVSEQMDLALSFSDAYSRETIRAYLDAPGEAREAVAALHALWLSGDEESLTAYMDATAASDEPDAQEVYRVLFVLRNERFADTCMEALKGDRRAMIAVGCGHLYGKDGVIRLLENEGCKVERID